MEFLGGETLADRLRKGAVPLNELLQVGIEVAEALEVAHRAGIVHRDLKPGNIMLTKSGAKLMDFGLAKPTLPGTAGAGSVPLLSAARWPLHPTSTCRICRELRCGMHEKPKELRELLACLMCALGTATCSQTITEGVKSGKPAGSTNAPGRSTADAAPASARLQEFKLLACCRSVFLEEVRTICIPPRYLRYSRVIGEQPQPKLPRLDRQA